MLRLFYELLNDIPGPVRSSDPILNILAKDPSALLGRRFAGYCLFLFGAADEQFATWFTRNLVSLDSLTGSEIACTVIAARVKVKVDRKSWEDRLEKLAKRKENLSQEIQISDIDQQCVKVERLVSHGNASWTGATSEITAVTYGTDAFAKQLGIVNELPCLIVLDAIPSKSFEILRLTEYATDSLISLLREVISRFQSHEYDHFFDNIAAVERLQRDSDDLRHKVDVSRIKLAKMKSMSAGVGLRDDRAVALAALVEGNLRGFKSAIDSAWDLQPQERSTVLHEVGPVAPKLLQNSKTITNLRYFSDLDIWPLQEPWLSRLCLIYNRHARAHLPDSSATPDASRDYCLSVLDSLQSHQQELAAAVLSHFPNLEDRLMVRRREHEQKCLAVEREIEDLRQTLEITQAELGHSVDSLLSGKYPSLKDAFRDTAKKRKLETARRTVGEAVFKMGAGLLKPETLLKIVETFHK